MYCLITDAFKLNKDRGKIMRNKKDSMESMLAEKS